MQPKPDITDIATATFDRLSVAPCDPNALSNCPNYDSVELPKITMTKHFNARPLRKGNAPRLIGSFGDEAAP
jgi:hypothetical protein